ncbi:MAG: hypothetical protein ACFUZC_15060 [Chthoniobacteraceae bacterium]
MTREFFILDDKYHSIPYAPRLTLVLNKRHDAEITPKLMPAIHAGLGYRTPKICLAQHLGNCSGPAIAAHTIQRSELTKLSTADRHVYGIILGGKTDKRNFMIPDRIGVRVATTFYGVCNRHDTELFYPIEVEKFTASTKQLFLFHYRSVLFEYHRRNFEYQKLEKIYNDLSLTPYVRDAKDLRRSLEANKRDKLEINCIKSECDRIFLSGAYAGCYLHAWEADQPPPIVGTLAFGPHHDLHGKRIQNPVGPGLLEWLSLTITIKDGRTLVVIGSECQTKTCRAFVESFESIPPENRMQALIVYALCAMENAVYLPHWWENGSPSKNGEGGQKMKESANDLTAQSNRNQWLPSTIYRSHIASKNPR